MKKLPILISIWEKGVGGDEWFMPDAERLMYDRGGTSHMCYAIQEMYGLRM